MATEQITTIDVPPVDKALDEFCHMVQRVHGVTSVQTHKVASHSYTTVQVTVNDLFSEITHNVIAVQEQVYDKYPNVRFELDIHEVGTSRKVILEKRKGEIDALTMVGETPEVPKDAWKETIGMFSNDPIMDRIMKEALKVRRSHQD